MRKIRARITITTLIFTILTVCSTGAMANDICEGVDIAWLRTHVPVPPSTIVDKSPLNGLCQVVLDINGQPVPVFAGRGFVVAGEMFQDRVQLTKAKIDRIQTTAMKQNLGALETIVAITHKPKNANGKFVYMLTDPLCPYCNTAIDQLKPIAEETGVTFKLAFANVHGTEGEAKIKEAICKEFDFDQYSQPAWKTAPAEGNTCSSGSILWSATQQVVSKLGLKGVPAFITQDGQFVSGANMPALKAAIEQIKDGDVASAKTNKGNG